MPKGDIKTTIPQNFQKLKIEWHLGYGHRGKYTKHDHRLISTYFGYFTYVLTFRRNKIGAIRQQ